MAKIMKTVKEATKAVSAKTKNLASATGKHTKRAYASSVSAIRNAARATSDYTASPRFEKGLDDYCAIMSSVLKKQWEKYDHIENDKERIAKKIRDSIGVSVLFVGTAAGLGKKVGAEIEVAVAAGVIVVIVAGYVFIGSSPKEVLIN